eukprot:COSAG01_NODE_3557_length_5939_cov_4.468151_4_plen_112_part_00
MLGWHGAGGGWASRAPASARAAAHRVDLRERAATHGQPDRAYASKSSLARITRTHVFTYVLDLIVFESYRKCLQECHCHSGLLTEAKGLLPAAAGAASRSGLAVSCARVSK